MKYIISAIRILFLALFLFLVLNGKMMLWLALFAVSLIVALLFGRVYCGYVCPMNTLMIPTEWLSKKLKLQTDKSPKWLRSGKFAWFALIGSIAVMLLAKKVLHKNIPILLIWLVVSILITLRYKPAVFHNLICPFGAIQKVFGRFAKFSEKVNKESCIGCKLCEKVCPSEAIEVKSIDKKAKIETSLCLQCTNCQQVCPKNAIHYSKQV
ncbi:4Fe-4S binding protein [Acidilutibacter cellobiosedens]|jgi:polyferredoxin|uniref:4Fe-4S binding protein n=1 Tax=Acidilutibacter cellobiosedens TaxID=2507161 RepID=A0A410QAI4_9FIRM|nr:4Fe-4S binding protein [Acidilutibacter cellobiosedens]QAT60995.1 4Fe-4S binding protein [Acidilutibacter cellobiosedens]